MDKAVADGGGMYLPEDVHGGLDVKICFENKIKHYTKCFQQCYRFRLRVTFFCILLGIEEIWDFRKSLDISGNA